MVSIKTYETNEVTQAINSLRTRIQGLGLVDPRIRAMINTHLQEAELLSLVLFETESK